ncbi:MAG TPA: HAD-IIA family hydrolase [Acidimicrobiales bacterium]|nr:HAD-IIA family hydrolase [Acidimicrobiales bacterium]
MAWILDLDGVIWLGPDVVPGVPEAVARLRDAGERVLFLTNNSSRPVSDVLGKLDGMGIAAEPDEIATSALAAAAMLDEGSTALVCGGVGVEEALDERGVRRVSEGDADAVVVGWFKEFDYDHLTAAFHAVSNGARLIGTNDDPTYPTPDGPIPGGGALLAAVAVASGVKDPEVAGKPHQPMADLVRSRLGDDTEGVILVGDRPSTDGAMADLLGVKFALVMTGVSDSDDVPDDPAPAHVADDLPTLVDELLDQ